MPRTMFYFIVLAIEFAFIWMLQFINYYEPVEILMRSSMAVLIAFIAASACVGLFTGITQRIVNTLDPAITNLGFKTQNKRGKNFVGIIALTIVLNLGIHLFISSQPNVNARYFQRRDIDRSILTTLALVDSDNYEDVADRLKVSISYKNLKQIQRYAIQRMEDQRDIFYVARHLSRNYVGGFGAQGNGFDILITKLRRQGRQDLIYQIYKDVRDMNRTSVGFVGGSALITAARAIDRKEYLEEIVCDPHTPDFCVRIIKEKSKR